MQHLTYRIAQAEPAEPVSPNTEGMRTFDSHSGDSQPISVDSQGGYVYSSMAYWILGIALIGIVFVAFAFRRPGQKVV